MATNKKKITLKIDYSEEKFKALKISLKEKNKDLDEEIINHIESLYQRNVPKMLKIYVEDGESSGNKNE